MMKYLLVLAMFLSLAAPAFETSRQAATAAEASFRAGQLEKAAASFREALTLTPDAREKNRILFRLAEVLLRQRKYDETLKECSAALEQPWPLPSEAAMFHFFILRALTGKKAPVDEIVPHCRQIISLLPGHWIANTARSTVTQLLSARNVRRFDEAIAINLLYLEKDEMSADAEFETHVSLCRLHLATNRIIQAEQFLKKAHDLLADDTISASAPGKFALVKGEFLRKNRKFDAAIAEFLKVPGSPGMTRREISDSWNQAAEAACAKKDFQTAREYAAKAFYPNAWLIKVIEEALKRK